MELRHLRHFVAVAEELHFARAAKKLGIAQPPLSQSIMRLEQSLGLKLFERSSRAVRLTAAGVAFLPEARDIINRAELAKAIAQRVARGELAKVRIGFVPMSATNTLPRAVRAFQQNWPNVEVHLRERTSVAQVEALHNGSLDLGILVRDLVSTEGLKLKPIERYGYVAAISATSPLSRRSSLRLKDLEGIPLIAFRQQLEPNFFSPFSIACSKAGFTPRIQQQVTQPYTMFILVAHRLGVGIVQDTARHLKIEGVAFVPLEDMPASLEHEVALAWLPRAVSPVMRHLIAQIEKAART